MPKERQAIANMYDNKHMIGMSVSYKRKDYILSDQPSMFGHQEVVGFGNDTLCVKIIDRKKANKIIIKNHYSKKVYAATKYHFGVFYKGELLGVLQYGCAMNPASYVSIVKDSKEDEYLELNRMWLDDSLPKNTATQCMSLCTKVLRKLMPNLAWIQSFADERCGKYGVVYQAANFLYCGEHKSDFWELDGVIYHNIQMTVSKGTKRYNKGAAYLQENKDQAKRMNLRQFRYIYFIKQSHKKRLLYNVLPYPKHYTSQPYTA